MTVTLTALQRQRRDTAANWTSNNPTLLAGELGYESDTGKWKVGDGSTAWTGLGYIPGTQLSAYPIVNADIASGAEIAVSKLADGAARQLLQTDAAGTGVEWTDNVDLPGTLDVTGVATFDGNVTVQGDLTVNGTQTIINTQTLDVEDKNIIIGNVGTPSDVTADGGGVTLKGSTDKTISWVDATDAWTSSERFSYPLGSASAPALTFTGDTNTGIYSPGADQVAISTNGTQRLFIGPTGGVGIGTETVGALVDIVRAQNSSTSVRVINADTGASADSRLTVNNGTTEGGLIYRGIGHPSAAHLVVFNNSTTQPITFLTSGSERLRITSDGKLGLGTSSPSYKLTIVDGGSTWHFRDNLDDAELLVLAETGQQAAIIFGDATDNVRGSVVYDTSNDSLQLKGYNNTERIRIDSSGRVGIGTTSPVAPLHVSNAIPTLVLDETDGTTTHAQNWLLRNGNEFQIQTRTNAGVYAGVDYAIPSSTSGATGHVWYITNTERARIDSSGRLLVGTSTARSNFYNASATAQFQIEGDGYMSVARNYNDEFGTQIFIAKSRSSTNTVLQANDNIGAVSWQGNDGSEFVESARINCEVDGTPGANDMPGRLVFSVTADGSASPTEAMRINNAGELLVGYTSDNGAYKLQVNSQIFATSATIATSDGRYKENVASLDGCLDLVKALRPVSFTWKPQGDITRLDDEGNEVLVREGHNFPKGTQVGFIAQEVQEVLDGKPWLSSVIKENVRPAVKDNEGNELAPEEQFYGIAEGNLIAVLTNALQEAVGRIEALEAEVAALKS